MSGSTVRARAGHAKTSRADKGIVLSVLFSAGLILSIFVVDSQQAKGGIAVLLMIVLLATGMPVAVAMGLAGGIGIYSLQGPNGYRSAMERLPYDTMVNWSLTVIPMFIFMGMLLWRSGATDRLFGGVQQWFSWLPGGLGVTTNAAGGALGAASGSTLGIAYAVGRIAIPSMLSAGYPKRLAISSVLMAGIGGQLIPPSLLLVVYAGIASTPTGDQLLAGLVPGVLLHAANAVLIVVIAVFAQRRRGGRFNSEPTSWSGRLHALVHLLPIPLVVVGVIGGIYLGIFTATEAGAAGAFLAMLIVLGYQRGRTFGLIYQAARDTVGSVGAIFFLLVGAGLLTRALALSGLTTQVATTIEDLNLGRVQFLLLLIVFYVILGMFVEPVSMMLLTVPLLLPVIVVMEIDVIWFGVFVTLMGEMAVITPPVGMLLFVILGLSQDSSVNKGQKITFKDVSIAAVWLLPLTFGLALLLIAYPDIVTWLLP